MQMKNIVIDQGNSSFKIGVFEGKDLMDVVEYEKRKDVISFVLGFSPEYVLISSVVRKNKKLIKKLSPTIKVARLTSEMPVPFKNKYQTPQTLGSDRMAVIAAASDLYHGENCLVIDAGTCITYDFIDQQNTYWGGGISPGVDMRFQSLNHFTSKLPLVQKINKAPLIGASTKGSIESGVINGVTEEVKGVIEQYQLKYKDVRVILCGGDSNFFESKLKGHIFAVANFVLIGLNRILLYNIDKFEALQ